MNPDGEEDLFPATLPPLLVPMAGEDGLGSEPKGGG